MPRNLTYFWTFGAILMFMLVAQIVTGVFLAMYYTPNATMAFQSIEHIMRDVNYGWLLRYLHANGASMFFIAVYIHIFRGIYYGSYKAPARDPLDPRRHHLPPDDGDRLHGLRAALGPDELLGRDRHHQHLLGDPGHRRDDRELSSGAAISVGNPTLNRFFSLHYLLPFMIFGVVILHVWALHVPGNNNPTGVPIKSGKDVVPFHPYMTIKDTFSLVLFLIFFAWWVFYIPNYLGHADNYIPANPAVTPSHIVPEWYFLPFYAILRAIPNKLGGVIAMFGAIAVLAFLPWLDTSRVRSTAYRPLYKQFFWVFVAVSILLGWLGSKPAEGCYVIAAQVVHGLLLRPLPDRAAAARLLREAAAAAELDPRGRDRRAEGRSRDSGRRHRRSAIQGLRRALRTNSIMIKRILLLAAALLGLSAPATRRRIRRRRRS